jgi:hypothetical protein
MKPIFDLASKMSPSTTVRALVSSSLLWAATAGIGHAQTTPEADFLARSTAPGVVRAMGFETSAEWSTGIWNPGRDNAWDTTVKASGAGSLRFDIKSNTGEGSAGSWWMNFSPDMSVQFGANEEFWIQWRQRFDTFVIDHDYQNTSGSGDWKQIIIGQGDTPTVQAYSCTENEIVMGKSGSHKYPAMYAICGDYSALETYLGDATSQYTRQNMRVTSSGASTCMWLLPGDESGCLRYVPNEWMTFMVHIKLGPLGTASSSIGPNRPRNGFTDSTIEFYVGREGQPLQLAHRHEGIVIPRGDHWNASVGINPDADGDPGYSGGWSRHDAHPNSRYGKLWLLPFNTNKDPAETHANASMWYDEVIVSRQRIADPMLSGLAPTPTVSLSASASTVVSGSSATLNWSSTDATACMASSGWSGSKSTVGSQGVGPLTATTSYTLVCTGTGGATSTPTTATITVSGSTPAPTAPTVTLSAAATSIASGSATTLTWSATNATSCNATGGANSWAGSKGLSGNISTGTLTSNTTFTLTCTGAGGSTPQNVTVAVTSGTTTPPPVVPPTSPATPPTVEASGGGGAIQGLVLVLLGSLLRARFVRAQVKS